MTVVTSCPGSITHAGQPGGGGRLGWGVGLLLAREWGVGVPPEMLKVLHDLF